MNDLIEQIFNNFIVPVSFLRYDGNATAYVTYQQTDISTTLSGDDALINYVEYYDFDVYSKGNYFPIVEGVKEILIANGFSWQPTRDSADMFEDDTGYFHKTLCFSIERSI
jgi:hypothetical protein